MPLSVDKEYFTVHAYIAFWWDVSLEYQCIMFQSWFFVSFLLEMETDTMSIWPRMEPFLLGALQVYMLLPSIYSNDNI